MHLSSNNPPLVAREWGILHSIVKKSQATPDRDLKLARRRMKEVQS